MLSRIFGSKITISKVAFFIVYMIAFVLGMLMCWALMRDENPPTTRVWAEVDDIEVNSWRTGNGDLVINYCGNKVTFSDWRTFQRYGTECPDEVYESRNSGNIEKIIFSDGITKVFFEEVEIDFPDDGEPIVKVGKKSEVLKGFDFTRPDTVLYEEGSQSSAE